MKKINLEKVKKLFDGKKVIVWTIVFVTAITLFLILVLLYTKDQPKIIPESIRENFREDVKGAIAEPLKKISKPLGEAVEDAAYDVFGSSSGGDVARDDNPTNQIDPTADWQNYTNNELGFSLRYPADLQPDYVKEEFEDYIGTVSFWEKEAKQNAGINLPKFDVDVFSVNEKTALSWVAEMNDPEGQITETSEVTAGENVFVRAIEAGDPDHVIFALKKDNVGFKFKTTLENEEYLKNVLEYYTN